VLSALVEESTQTILITLRPATTYEIAGAERRERVSKHRIIALQGAVPSSKFLAPRHVGEPMPEE
jgi:hypothetical protein